MSGTKVTVVAIDDPADTQTQVIENDYSLTCDGACYVAGIQVYPKAGTHVITIKNVGKEPA